MAAIITGRGPRFTQFLHHASTVARAPSEGSYEATHGGTVLRGRSIRGSATRSGSAEEVRGTRETGGGPGGLHVPGGARACHHSTACTK